MTEVTSSTTTDDRSDAITSATMGPPQLEVSGCTVRYGGVYANTDVSLSLYQGELLGLIGPNGAGKSSCIDAISGFVALESGSVKLAGEAIHHLSAPERAQLGLSRTFQSLDLFEDLSVADNLAVSRRNDPWLSLFSDAFRPLRRNRRDPVVADTLDRCGIGGLAERRPSELSHGQRNLVALARALASEPKVLLVDEPAAGLDDKESEALGSLLTSLTADGLSILLVDHDMSLVMGVCDRLTVLDFGNIIAEGLPAEVRANPAVRDAYLGAPGAEPEVDSGSALNDRALNDTAHNDSSDPAADQVGT